jgi:hypothetical protein
MKNVSKIALGIGLGAILILACCAAAALAAYRSGGLAFLGLDGRPAAPASLNSPATASLLSQVTDKAQVLSPAATWGQPQRLGAFVVTPLKIERLETYALEGGRQVYASEGSQFVWLQVRLQNGGDQTQTADFVFELYQAGQRLFNSPADAPRALERPGLRLDRMNPGEQQEGWVVFEVPQGLELNRSYLLARSMQGLDYSAWVLAE